MNTKPKIRRYAIPLAICVIVTLSTSHVYGVDRMLEYDWTVDNSKSYTYSSDSDWENDASSESGSVDVDCTMAYTVVEDNLDNSYDIDWDTSSVTRTIDNGTPEGFDNGADTEIQEDGRGKTLHQLDMTLLLPGIADSSWDFGSDDSEQTGPFPSVAVDVNDTWSQVVNVTPYNQSTQEMTISCKLLEWTTLSGYNVGKIQRTYMRPINAYRSSTQQTMSGNLSVTEYVWYSWDDKVLVKNEINTTGTVEISNIDIDVTNNVILTIQ